MKAALVGCGQMGRAAAYALATGPDTTELTLVDRDRERAVELAGWLAGFGGCPVRVAADPADALAGRDAVATALPWAATRAVIRTVVRTDPRVPVASITRPPTEELAGLDAWFRAAGATVLLPLGLEPGLTELLAVHVAQRLDQIEALEICCGGVPEQPREPLGYTAFFGGENDHHLPIAQREALALSGGRRVRHARFSGVETREVDGVGRLEAYHDGMAPWLGEHPLLQGVDCTQKTLRWPGFAQAVSGLARLGLLAEETVDVDGVEVPPKRVVERVLAPQVRARTGDRDLVVLEVTAHGRLAGEPTSLRSTVLDSADETTGLSAMARTTGFALAGATGLLAERSVTGAGWRKPHRTLSADQFEKLMGSLTARRVTWIPAHEIG
ncbi:saccharopine dehydrogenase [Streptomyces kaniharaensis]|uniref:Saccharopine dehydrogenase n=1 Tax=Streptomyces kaniharaensis TaxID=212423 RepID=A0A5S8ZI04_9ACTN|nr:saccharopine dehydrogenase C-terminal domain-containing protein [Streptomyces kaniharaensis]AVW82943.1 saccharopine dehydrogenase [Streptomyces kaniharaensis]MQS11310.1 saccharopine dehydrogenase [Streptomyces kaniharaensis]QTK22494.1 saccharopine dehydrogenase [Streptomyces kaniharaensis]